MKRNQCTSNKQAGQRHGNHTVRLKWPRNDTADMRSRLTWAIPFSFCGAWPKGPLKPWRPRRSGLPASLLQCRSAQEAGASQGPGTCSCFCDRQRGGVDTEGGGGVSILRWRVTPRFGSAANKLALTHTSTGGAAQEGMPRRLESGAEATGDRLRSSRGRAIGHEAAPHQPSDDMAPAKASALLCWIDPFVSPPIELQSPSPESMGLPPCLVSWLVLSSIPTVWAQRCRCACTLHKLLACPLRAAGSSQPKLNEADEGCPSELACQTSEAARPKFCPRCCQGHHVTTNGHDPRQTSQRILPSTWWAQPMLIGQRRCATEAAAARKISGPTMSAPTEHAAMTPQKTR